MKPVPAKAEAECPVYRADGPFRLRARDARGKLPVRRARRLPVLAFACRTPLVTSRSIDRCRTTGC